jgi:hypothetical protein
MAESCPPLEMENPGTRDVGEWLVALGKQGLDYCVMTQLEEEMSR